jgi:hypothetical protein
MRPTSTVAASTWHRNPLNSPKRRKGRGSVPRNPLNTRKRHLCWARSVTSCCVLVGPGNRRPPSTVIPLLRPVLGTWLRYVVLGIPSGHLPLLPALDGQASLVGSGYRSARPWGLATLHTLEYRKGTPVAPPGPGGPGYAPLVAWISWMPYAPPDLPTRPRETD